MSLRVMLKTRIMEGAEKVLIRFAVDFCPESEKAPTLIIAPHPDDETLSCGATILRLRKAGVRVRVVVVTDGRSSEQTPDLTPDELAVRREKETIKACKSLGISPADIVFLRYKDREAIENIESIARDLAKEIDPPPKKIFLPSTLDKNKDHKATALAAAKAIASRGITTYAYIAWFSPWSFFRALPLLATGRFRRVETKAFAEAKTKAFKAHATQYGKSKDFKNSFWSRFFLSHEIFIES